MGNRETGVAAVVLAGGGSRRMAPDNKLLARIGDRAMVAWCVDAALESQAAPVIVVTGYQDDAVRAALGERPVVFAHNADFALGLAGSVRVGVAAVPERARAAVLCLGDMPLVGAAVLDRLITAYGIATAEGGGATGTIVVPTVAGRRGNPVLWDRCHFGAMATLSGDQGARCLMARHPDTVVSVALDEGSPEGRAVLCDFDTADSLKEVFNRNAT